MTGTALQASTPQAAAGGGDALEHLPSIALDHQLTQNLLGPQLECERFGAADDPAESESHESVGSDGAPVGPTRAVHALLEAAEEELGSGGPPLSPVHDSLRVTWGILDLELGRTQEAFASVARSLLTRLSVLPECVEQLRALEEEPLGVFAVRKIEPPRVGASARVTLRDVATDRELSVQFAEHYDVRSADLLLVRPTMNALGNEESPTSATRHPTSVMTNPPRHGGTWRSPESRIYRIRCRTTTSTTKTSPSSYPVVPPGADPTTRSQLMIQRRIKMLTEIGHEGVPKLEPELRMLEKDRHSDWAPIVIATGLSEGGSNTGPLLDLLERRFDFDADLREWAAATRAGWVSLFEVLSADPGEGMRVLDVIRGGEYDVVERSGSRMLKPGMLLFGRLISYRGVHMFEITLNTVARPGTEQPIIDAVKAGLRDRPMRGSLVFDAANTWIEVSRTRQRSAMPTLTTTTGEPLVFCVIDLSFSKRERPRVRQAIGRLQRCHRGPAPDGAGEEQFVVHTRSDMVEARLLLSDDTLRVESNAKERADAVLNRLRSKLPKVLHVEHREAVPMADLLSR